MNYEEQMHLDFNSANCVVHVACVCLIVVLRSQFRRVLSELDLSKLITELEWLVLWKKFNVQVGGRHDYDYLSFCHTINSIK